MPSHVRGIVSNSWFQHHIVKSTLHIHQFNDMVSNSVVHISLQIQNTVCQHHHFNNNQTNQPPVSLQIRQFKGYLSTSYVQCTFKTIFQNHVFTFSRCQIQHVKCIPSNSSVQLHPFKFISSRLLTTLNMWLAVTWWL